jgi:hypothetical protein
MVDVVTAIYRPPGIAGKHTPLWYYILKEAEILCDGKKLGPVGGRIVAEVFIGLLLGDKLSYLNVVPRWEPKAGAFGTQKDGEFTIELSLNKRGPNSKAQHRCQ